MDLIPLMTNLQLLDPLDQGVVRLRHLSGGFVQNLQVRLFLFGHHQRQGMKELGHVVPVLPQQILAAKFFLLQLLP